MEKEKNTISYMIAHLTCDELSRAWDLFYRWSERTIKKRGVKPKDWKQWLADNKTQRRKCDKYFPTISVKEGRDKFKEIVEKVMRTGYYGIPP